MKYSTKLLKNIQKDYNCPVLEELYLQDNRLENIPWAIFRLPTLLTIDVSNNKLQELPYEMWKSPKLRELNLAFNLLKDLPILPNVSGIYFLYLLFPNFYLLISRKCYYKHRNHLVRFLKHFYLIKH